VSLDYRCKPIIEWPDKLTPHGRRKRGTFSTSYSRTLIHLERELNHLNAKQILFQLALDESEIRLDGRPRADARPSHPGVIVTFNSKHGPLSYWTDQYTDWQSNVRAISLALEALRAVDRHGVNKSGSQYQGYKRLGTSEEAKANGFADWSQAAAFIASHTGLARIFSADIGTSEVMFKAAYKEAAKRLHPDNIQTGNNELFVKLQDAAAVVRKRLGL